MRLVPGPGGKGKGKAYGGGKGGEKGGRSRSDRGRAGRAGRGVGRPISMRGGHEVRAPWPKQNESVYGQPYWTTARWDQDRRNWR